MKREFDFILEEARLQALAKVYDNARAAPFYARKYEGFPTPRAFEEWHRLPLLTRQELYDNTYPRSTSMLTAAVKGMIVTSTGGSSGIARYSTLSYEEWNRACAESARSLMLNGVTPSDRVANLFMAGHLWPSFLGAHDILRMIEAVHLPISCNIPPEEIVKLCVEFNPTVLISLPTLLIFVADIALRENIRLPALRMLGYAGEQLSKEAEAHLRRALSVEVIFALAYTSADAGLMGYACPQCAPGVYHMPTAFQFIEVLDPAGRPCPAGTVGELVVTSLYRFSMPLVRYLIGDMGCFLPESCACGDRNPLFRLAGRAGEDFKLGGGFISMRVFDESIAAAGGMLSPNYQLELEDVANQIEIRLLIETASPNEAAKLEKPLREEISNRMKEIDVGIRMGFVRTFDVRFVELGALPRSPITGKVKRLNDKRF